MRKKRIRKQKVLSTNKSNKKLAKMRTCACDIDVLRLKLFPHLVFIQAALFISFDHIIKVHADVMNVIYRLALFISLFSPFILCPTTKYNTLHDCTQKNQGKKKGVLTIRTIGVDANFEMGR